MNIKKIILCVGLSFQIANSSQIEPNTIVEIIQLEDIPYVESSSNNTIIEQDFNVEHDYVIEYIDLLNFEPQDKDNGQGQQ